MEQLETISKSAKHILQRYRELPENLQTQLYDFTEFLYQKRYKKTSENVEDYETFEEWNSALDMTGKYQSEEYLPEEGMTVKEYRKMIWEMEKSGEGISLNQFKNEMKLWTVGL